MITRSMFQQVYVATCEDRGKDEIMGMSVDAIQVYVRDPKMIDNFILLGIFRTTA